MNKRIFAALVFLGVLLHGNIYGQKAKDANAGRLSETGEGKKGGNMRKGYGKFTSNDVEREKGLFTIYSIGNNCFFEINDTLLGRDMLLGSRVAEVSNTSKIVAGEMRKSPVLIRFSRDIKNVYLHQVVSNNISEADDAISISVKRNSILPILKTFPIEAFNKDSTGVVIDVTRFFSEQIAIVSPFNSKYKAGKLEKESTFILKKQAFPKNVEIKTRMSYSNTTGEPFLTIMNRSILLLPKTPMKPRLEDKRIGYFVNSAKHYSSDNVGVKTYKYISRFRVTPKDEDLEKYKSGEMVEPEKPIVFYIDNAFPKEWRKYIKAGVEDWQEAFRAIGFKNAIIAKDYPLDDPDFNPEDIRYSCIRYISMAKANSQGPRWIDPRSGEVIGGDVLWWHNVTVLLRDWRFVQCAAADPKARNMNPDMETMGAMIRYVTAHEVGHTLGLKHNMRASYAYPVDSLRSANFTQKNGTTPSIMDYARFNYIAQPGDTGIRFLPPNLGAYDIFAIEWGYKPIFGVEKSIEERPVLNQWILKKSDEIIYRYGDQQIGLAFDPASQNEALGDDAIKAGTYGVANARYIMEHLIEWTTEKDRHFDDLNHMYDELLKQYMRYMGHVNAYLGGVYIYKLVEGEDNKQFYNPVGKKKQKEALQWMFNQLESQAEWILNKEIERRLGSRKSQLLKAQAKTMDNIMSIAIFQRLELYHQDYTCIEFLDDIYGQVWKKTFKKQPLSDFDRQIQFSFVKNLLVMSGTKNSAPVKKQSFSNEALSNSTSAKIPFIDYMLKPLLYQKIDETNAMLKKHLKDKDPETRAHYQYLYEMTVR